MICDDMLELMLEADPAELEGRGNSTLAGHLRDCTRCGRVAAQLLTDTRRLDKALESRRAMPARPLEAAARPSLWRPIVMFGALAAAIVLFVFMKRVPDGPGPLVASVVATPRIIAVPTAASVARVPRTTHPRRFEAASPVQAKRFESVPALEVSASAEAVAMVSVDPPPGKRAIVMRTSDPNITVVWLY